MLLCSFKIKKHTVTLISLICAAVFVMLCFFMLKLSPADTVKVGDNSLSLRIESEEDIAAFLSDAGVEADKPILKREVVIPEEWNDFYTSYADMQNRQGFDLDKFKGKNAVEYTYSLRQRDDYAVVLVCDNIICAAHLSALDGSGEMKSLINNPSSEGTKSRQAEGVLPYGGGQATRPTE